MGRSDDVSLVVGENGMTESLADIASFGDSTHLRGNCDEEAKLEGGMTGA